MTPPLRPVKKERSPTMKNARTAAFGALFRRAAALLFLLALSALAACPAFADTASTVWVDGVEITAPGAALPVGVTWDGSVLTLNNANLTRTHFDSRDFREAAILANGDLTIRLTGTNTISVANGTYRLDGICAAGVVTIEGDGSLTVNATASPGSFDEVSGLATKFTAGEAGLVVNGGTITLSASGDRSFGLSLDTSYSGTLPPRYLKVNGGSLTLIGAFAASYAPPDISNYSGAVVSASFDVSGTPAAQYTPFQPGLCYYKYLKISTIQYDENGFAEGGHYQPAVLAADGAYEISNAGQLFWFGQKVAEAEANATLNARLTTDITIPAGREWTPIAAGKYGVPYTGTFNGQSYAITGLTVSAASTMNVSSGLVKTLGAGGVVKNLTLRNASIVPPSGYAGAVCGANYGTIENCFAEGGQIGVTAMYGGGVTGDLVGFAAATYLRGIRFVQIPTTFLAAIDSSVGGKTAVNIPAGKNLIGAFHQPSLVVCDPDTFSTLTPEIFADGCAEMIKYAMIWSEEFLQLLESCDIQERLEEIVAYCVDIKRQVVEQDEHDTGIRMILNYGHTLGHAIEKVTNHAVSHGQGVAMGMVLITRLGMKLGRCDAALLHRLCSVLERYHLPCHYDGALSELAESCLHDKKRSGSTIRLILVSTAGKADILPMDTAELETILKGELPC